MTVQVQAPPMGESVSEAVVARWEKQEGDLVAEDELLAELETDKVNLEVTAPKAGKLVKIATPAGSTVTVGALMAEIDEVGGAAEATTPQPAEQPTASAAAPVAASVVEEVPHHEEEDEPVEYTSNGDLPPLSPSVRKLVEENGLNPASIGGTGKGGRITKADVVEFMAKQTVEGASSSAPGYPATQEVSSPDVAQAASQATQTAVPAAPASLPGGSEVGSGQMEERVPMSQIRKTIATRLKTAQNTAALLTTYNEVDLSNVIALRKKYKETFKEKHGVNLGFMSFFTKAVVEALKAWPALNAEIQGEELVYKKYYNVGIAVSTERGLMVPVIRDADKKSFAEIEQEIAHFAGLAREGKLGLDAMAGGTFTITNGGVFGSMMSMPILNYPQVGILGMHAIKERPVVVDGEIVVRPMMYVAMTYDHRIVDGRESVSFLVKVKEGLEDPSKLLLSV